MPTKLRVENLTKTFGDEVAIDGLTLSIEEGNLKSLLGPSGCGKTTTLRCIAGLETPDSGRIYVDDELVAAPEENVDIPPEKREIGMVFQSYAVWPHMSVRENVGYPLKVRKQGSKQEREEKIHSVLERVGLEEYADNLATNLSGGQQQRVAIARALVIEPDIILFDEPLSNLDAKLRRDLRIEIKRLYEEFNTTVLYVTHSQDEAMFLSDRIALMLNGHIVEEGDPVELHTDPQTFFGMNFMGQSNTYPGVITQHRSDSIVIETRIGDLDIPSADGYAEHDRVFACFRPKACRIVQSDGEVSDGEISFSGTVSMHAATMDFFEYEVDIGGDPVLIRSLDPYALEEGDSISVAIERDDIKLFANKKDLASIDTYDLPKSTADKSMATEISQV